MSPYHQWINAEFSLCQYCNGSVKDAKVSFDRGKYLPGVEISDAAAIFRGSMMPLVDGK